MLRNDMSDPWVTEEENEQILKEFRYLNSVDPTTKNWRDLAWLYFSPNVLDKYKNNTQCEIGERHISFLAKNRDDDLTVNFEFLNGRLMVQSKYYCFVPPKERKHWETHQLPEDIETSDDNLLK